MNYIRRFQKNKSLRIINLLGLSIIFACIILSYAYIRYECGYDRFHADADRIVRLSLQYGDEAVDVRVYGFKPDDPLIDDIPEIEDIGLLSKVNTGVLKSGDKLTVINDFYFVSPNFFGFFDFRLLEGDKADVLDSPSKVVISRRLAAQLFGDEPAMGKEILLSGRQFEEQQVFVSGVFEDFPQNAHFHTDLLLHLPQDDERFTYVYLLPDRDTDIQTLRQKIQANIDKLSAESGLQVQPLLMPLTDIHLHSHFLREHETNGNIHYVYLIIGANALLVIIVFFNLWLNGGLIFSYNRRYYRLLRLHGASSATVLKDECLSALLLGLVSIALAGIAICCFVQKIDWYFPAVSWVEMMLIAVLFLVLTVTVSLIPVISDMAATLFTNEDDKNLLPDRFTFSNIKYMLTAQYCIVMFILILAFGIGRQMKTVRQTQVGGNAHNILVIGEQSESVKARYDLLKSELLKHSEITSVTACMQLPGDAILDAVHVHREGESEDNSKRLAVMVAGDDFLPFFDIRPIAGTNFRPTTGAYREEETRLFDYLSDRTMVSDHVEEYVINRKAVEFLGFSSAQEAVGSYLYLTHNTLGYIGKGQICGVSDNFTYTNMYESNFPLIILQRKLFLNCIMIRFDEDRIEEGILSFRSVWSAINPSYPVEYTFMSDVFGRTYRNELYGESLVNLYSALGLLISNLGLIVFIAFIVKRKRKEIAIRKINGATSVEIISMLHLRFLRWLLVAFLIAVPFAYYVLLRWMSVFVDSNGPDWLTFVLAGLFVLLTAVLSIWWQSWRAANTNPAAVIKSE
ncbi:MAG: ABC transporter permease [Prevotellaceae bacterium]|jgi:putative ABC transport system permease protein|nr:ABC transporter permease [Prevotellaceae bacterium]